LDAKKSKSLGIGALFHAIAVRSDVLIALPSQQSCRFDQHPSGNNNGAGLAVRNGKDLGVKGGSYGEW
jgi:hypothetical protein